MSLRIWAMAMSEMTDPVADRVPVTALYEASGIEMVPIPGSIQLPSVIPAQSGPPMIENSGDCLVLDQMYPCFPPSSVVLRRLVRRHDHMAVIPPLASVAQGARLEESSQPSPTKVAKMLPGQKTVGLNPRGAAFPYCPSQNQASGPHMTLTHFQ